MSGGDRDPDDPPAGCVAVWCVNCGGLGAVQVPRKALGPIPAFDLVDGEVGTVIGEARCRVCRGHGWVWGAASDPAGSAQRPEESTPQD